MTTTMTPTKQKISLQIYTVATISIRNTLQTSRHQIVPL